MIRGLRRVRIVGGSEQISEWTSEQIVNPPTNDSESYPRVVCALRFIFRRWVSRTSWIISAWDSKLMAFPWQSKSLGNEKERKLCVELKATCSLTCSLAMGVESWWIPAPVLDYLFINSLCFVTCLLLAPYFRRWKSKSNHGAEYQAACWSARSLARMHALSLAYSLSCWLEKSQRKLSRSRACVECVHFPPIVQISEDGSFSSLPQYTEVAKLSVFMCPGSFSRSFLTRCESRLASEVFWGVHARVRISVQMSMNWNNIMPLEFAKNTKGWQPLELSLVCVCICLAVCLGRCVYVILYVYAPIWEWVHCCALVGLPRGSFWSRFS